MVACCSAISFRLLNLEEIIVQIYYNSDCKHWQTQYDMHNKNMLKTQ